MSTAVALYQIEPIATRGQRSGKLILNIVAVRRVWKQATLLQLDPRGLEICVLLECVHRLVGTVARLFGAGERNGPV